MTCRVMQDLNKVIKKIEEQHNIKLSDSEVEHLKRLHCSYMCNGRCRSYYHTPLQ